jgi:glucokinase
VHALDVGGTHVNAAIVEITGSESRIVSRAGHDLDSAGAREDVLEGLVRAALELKVDGDEMDLAIAMPGPFDYATGHGTFVGVGKFGSIAGVDLRDEFSKRLGTTPGRVRFLNDADAYGLGEWAFGGVGRPERLVCVTLGTGVGSAFIDNGTAVDSGPEVPVDGEAHLLTYRGLPLEESVSTRAILRAFTQTTSKMYDVRRIAEVARGGDSDARGVLDEAMRALGIAMAPWLESFRASVFVVGGSMAKSWDILEAPLVAALEESGARLDGLVIRPSTLFDDSPLLGAAEWLVRTTA